jgi:Xaa-Pro aminopeptidase
MWDEHFAVRIEDVVVCAEGGGRMLNELPRDAVIRSVDQLTGGR